MAIGTLESMARKPGPVVSGRSVPVGEPRDQWRRHIGSQSRTCASSTSRVKFVTTQYTDRYVYCRENHGLPYFEEAPNP